MTIFGLIVALCMMAVAGQAASWQALGPEGGNFVGTVINPENASQVITIAGDAGIAYRTDDGGATWSRLSAIADSGLFDMYAYDFSTLYATDGSICYRSDDGGVSWSKHPFPSVSGSDQVQIKQLCVHPTDPDTIFAAGTLKEQSTGKVVLRYLKSTDGGETWSAQDLYDCIKLYVNGMTIAKTDPNQIYICGYAKREAGWTGVLFKSADGGDTMTDLSSSLEISLGDVFQDVAVDPTDADRVYLPTVNWTRHSTDGCATLQKSSPGRGYAIAIDPTDPSIIYVVLSNDIYQSTDYAQSWTRQDDLLETSSALHIAVAPSDSNQIYISTTKGLFVSKNGGNTYSLLNNGINAFRIPTLALAPSNPSRLLIQIGGKGIVSSDDSGMHWISSILTIPCIESLLIHPTNPNRVLALQGYG